MPALKLCEGCDTEQFATQVLQYVVTFDSGKIEEVAYCRDCADLARMNFNGVTVGIEPAHCRCACEECSKSGKARKVDGR